MRVNGADTHPTVSIALVAVEFTADEVVLTLIVSHEFVVPVSVVNAALLMLYAPPTIETTACPPIPEIVTGLDIYTVESSVFVTPEKLKLSGVTSAGAAKAKRDS